jgi:hypothetical protein
MDPGTGRVAANVNRSEAPLYVPGSLELAML